MKMCMDHWNKLKQAIDVRGLTHLVSKSGAVATERTVAQIEGRDSEKDFDPLMAANFAIWSRALEVGGLYLMGQAEDGSEYCPLCELDKFAKQPDGSSPTPPASEQWIEGCCDAQRDHAIELGLVARPN